MRFTVISSSADISAELQVFNPSEPIRAGPDSPGNPNLQQRSGLPAEAIMSLLLSTSLRSQATVFHFPVKEECEIFPERGAESRTLITRTYGLKQLNFKL